MALTRGNILSNAVGRQYVAMVIIALAYLNNRPTSRERYPVTLLFSALLAPLIKLLSYLYTNASVILLFYLFISIIICYPTKTGTLTNIQGIGS